MATQLWSVGLVMLAGVTGSLGPIMLKKASGKLSFRPKELIKNYNLMIGFLLYGAATALFIPALKGGELSVLYPLISITYIWVILWSLKLLNEKMNKMKWVGIFLIVIGVAFIGLGA
ncbi:EamA family transporter [Candidatus Woesearchaeota archaeon]|nr:EamA family transporter [Candidatus Woesearchaeota archaeon]